MGKTSKWYLCFIPLMVILILVSPFLIFTGYSHTLSGQALRKKPDDVLFIVGGGTKPSVEVLSLNDKPIICNNPPKELPVPTHSTKWPTFFKHKGDPVFCLGENESPCLKYSQKYNNWERFHQLLVKRRATEKLEFERAGYVAITGGSLNATVTHSSSDFWNPRTHEFTCGPELPYTTEGHCIVTIDNMHAILTGGYNSEQGYRNSTYIYNRRTCQWTKLADMGHKRRYHSCGLVDKSKVVVVGGYDGIYPAPYLSSVEVYDLRTKKWSSGPNFPLLLYGATTMQLNDTFIVIGGKRGSDPDAGLPSQELKSIFQFNMHNSTWLKRKEELKSHRFEKPAVYRLPAAYFSCVDTDKKESN